MTTDTAAGENPEATPKPDNRHKQPAASTGEQGEAPARDHLVNRVLAGRYELLEMLGEGPLLSAFRARDRSANRLVTIKVIRQEFIRRQDVLNDLKAGLGKTLALQHPNIARALDVGTDEESGLLFLAEEYVRGIDLKERIRRVAPFQLSAATETAIALVEALEVAHGRGIAHGDVRPQNVLIGPDGQVKITGFGIASAQMRAAVEDTRLLRRVIGYIAPDAARAAAPTTSGDLYAVGVILYEMLTGDIPYSGETAVQVALRHAQDPIPSPRQINAGVPNALEGITRKALGKTPTTRYPDAATLLKDLRAVRDALRYGKSLAWSPLDPPAAPIAPAAAAPARESATGTGTAPAVAPATTAVVSSVTLPSPPNSSEPPTADGAGGTGVGAGGEGTVVMPAVLAKKNAARQGAAKPDPPQETPMYEEEAPVRSGGVGRWMLFINLLLGLLLVVAVGYVVNAYLLPVIQPNREVVVPDLVGKKMPDAETLAIDKNFKLEIVAREYREKEAKDVIFQQSTPAGRRIKEGKPIGIWVSLGPRMVEVPDTSGMSIARARRLIESRGLRLGQVKYEHDPLEARGNVIRQSPQPTENVARGTKVELTLSNGEAPEAVSDPLYMPSTDTSTPEPEATPTPEGRERYYKVEYPVPKDGQEHRIRIDILDDEGPRTLVDETVEPGTTLKRERIRVVGDKITIKVFDNDEIAYEINQ